MEKFAFVKDINWKSIFVLTQTLALFHHHIYSSSTSVIWSALQRFSSGILFPLLRACLTRSQFFGVRHRIRVPHFVGSDFPFRNCVSDWRPISLCVWFGRNSCGPRWISYYGWQLLIGMYCYRLHFYLLWSELLSNFLSRVLQTRKEAFPKATRDFQGMPKDATFVNALVKGEAMGPRILRE